MRLIGFVVGVVAVLASLFVAIVMQMVGGVTGRMTALDISVWAAVILSVVGSATIWRRPLWAAVSFFAAAAWILFIAHYVALPAGVFLLGASVIALLAQRKRPSKPD